MERHRFLRCADLLQLAGIEGVPRFGLEVHLLVATVSGRLDPPGFEPTGRTVELTGMCAYEFRGGLIAHHSMFFDVMSFSQQIGLMPAMDSAPVKALVGVQNLTQKIVRLVKQ
jgi:hypothetical protein